MTWKVVPDDYRNGYWVETDPESDNRKWFPTRREAERYIGELKNARDARSALSGGAK